MKILVADSSRVIRQILREELEGSGFEVMDTEHGADVFLILNSTDIDLVTLAVELHDMNGYDICQYIRRGGFNGKSVRNSNVPVIFITGNDVIEERKKGFAVGAADFIVKPFPPGFVSGVVRRLLKPESRLEGLEALVIDDSKMARDIVSSALKQEGVVVHEVSNGDAGYEFLKENLSRLDLVITDLIMPGMSGDELTSRIRNELQDLDLPVLVMSGEDHKLTAIDIFRSGATDYLIKPFIKEELMARIRVHLKARLLNRLLLARLRDLEHLNTQLKSLASRDHLTGLSNRKTFMERFREAIKRKQVEGLYLTFMIVDIDYFKKINDSLGHHVGDQVIQETAKLIRAVVKRSAIIGRLGGEEFGAIVLSHEKGSGFKLADKLCKTVASHKFITEDNGKQVTVTVSIGAHMLPPGKNSSPEEIYIRADEKLYRAKMEGRNRYCCEQ